MKYDRPNDPNAGRLIESLRHLGYGNYEAIADLVDNAIDADAQQVRIRIQQKAGQHQISIADAGTGMTKDVLDQAMRLGSMTSRDVNSDLGRFGMGLVTASLSIAKKCHVITRADDGCWSSAWDVDEIVTQNSFLKHLDAATREEVALLDNEIGASSTGTLVILTKCDNLGNKNPSVFASTLKNHIGRVHRYFIGAGRKIQINEDTVSAIDPLQLSDPATEIVVDDVFVVSIDGDGTDKQENIRVRIVLVPENPATELDVAKSMKSQGFYIMRNQREIMNAVTLDFFTKHNDFNRMRGEVFFPGTLDRMVGIEFTKREVKLNQSLYDQLASTLVPTCRSIKRQESNKNRVATSEVQQQIHKQAAKVIAEKDKLLIKPKAVIEKRDSRKNGGGTDHTPKPEPERERKNLTRTQALETRLNCEIREEKMGPNGQIYECDMEGRRLVLRYNIEHPFYQRFIVENIADGRVVTAADFLIYSMATAELRMLESGDLDVVNNFKAVMSSNLRTLLN
ncbi:MAG TPA: ATP-binding protein [Terriglobales bacterium]|nr:ATP-binding protein [Terriglobales bacterium]